MASCSPRGDTIAQGELSYNAGEVFEHDASALDLARAAGAGNEAAVSRLARAGAKVNFEGKYEITPLWWAAWAKNYEGFLALLEHGADPNAKRSAGLPVMHLVARIPDERFLIAALRYGGDPEAKDPVSRMPPLFFTVQFHLRDNTRHLLEAGANMNVQSPISGGTFMMEAIGSSGDYQLVYDFLQRGADYSQKTKQGKTVADFIATRAIDPNGEQYLWREKVILFLRDKGIEAHIPSRETARTVPK